MDDEPRLGNVRSSFKQNVLLKPAELGKARDPTFSLPQGNHVYGRKSGVGEEEDAGQVLRWNLDNAPNRKSNAEVTDKIGHFPRKAVKEGPTYGIKSAANEPTKKILAYDFQKEWVADMKAKEDVQSAKVKYRPEEDIKKYKAEMEKKRAGKTQEKPKFIMKQFQNVQARVQIPK